MRAWDTRDVVNLSPGTLQAIAEGPTALTQTRRRAATKPLPPQSEVVARRAVHPLVMAAALEAAGGDVSRISFRPDGSAVITAHARPGVDKRAQR